MNAFAPLLAAGVNVDTLVTILLAILVFVAPAIGQLLNKLRQMQPPAVPQRPPVPTDVTDEIEQFMRRAVDRHGGGPARPLRPSRSWPAPSSPSGPKRLPSCNRSADN